MLCVSIDFTPKLSFFYLDLSMQQDFCMSHIRIFFLSIISICFLHARLQAMVYDNRFFPLIKQPFLIVDGRPSHGSSNLFILTGSKAIGTVEDEIGIPELFGKFDLKQISSAVSALGLPNPLRSELRGLSFPYSVQGVLQAQGLAFAYEQATFDWLKLGLNWFFMNSSSRQEFFLDTARLFPGVSAIELDEARRTMFQELGLFQANAQQFGLSDLDVYARFGYQWCYVLKFRRIDAGARLGMLVPTGVTTQLNSPASVPFGGNGFWGMYGQIDAEFELREDLTAGLYTRLSKRFTKTKVQRLPIDGEPQIFGASCGPVTITPGLTFVFSPYVCLENLRAGMGVRLLYTLTKHWADCWKNGSNTQGIPVTLGEVNTLNEWKSDYVTLNVFYDFGKVKECRALNPIIFFTWDIPSLLFASERSATTHRISLGVELNF